MVKEIVKIGEPTSPGLKEGPEIGVGPIEIKPVEVEAGANAIAEKIAKRVEAIESGEAPAVAPEILKEAKEAISHETGSVAESRARLQHFLDMLNGGEMTDPAGALDQILDASAGNRSKPDIG